MDDDDDGGLGLDRTGTDRFADVKNKVCGRRRLGGGDVRAGNEVNLGDDGVSSSIEMKGLGDVDG
jgi:hypothetical protein